MNYIKLRLHVFTFLRFFTLFFFMALYVPTYAQKTKPTFTVKGAGNHLAGTRLYYGFAKTYGDNDFKLETTSSSSGTITYSKLSGAGNVSLSGTNNDLVTINGAGNLAVKVTIAETAIHELLEEYVEIMVSPVALTIKGNDVTKIYNTPNPAFTATYTGFVNGDNESSILSKPVTIDTKAIKDSPVGDYEFRVLPFRSINYTYIFIPGTLTITHGILFSPPGVIYLEFPRPLTATTTSGYSVTFKSSNPKVAVIENGDFLAVKGVGSTQITASSDKALDVVRTLVVKKGTPEISVSAGKYNLAKDLVSGGSYDFGQTNFDPDNKLTVLTTLDGTFKIENKGTASLNLAKISITGANAADFSIKSGSSSKISPFDWSNLVIRFKPLGKGVRTALVTIANDDADEGTYTFTITGKGLAPVINVKQETTVLAGSYDFGQVDASTGMETTFTIENTGGRVLTLSHDDIYSDASVVSLSGTHSANFRLKTPTSRTIPAGGSVTFKIAFTPSIADKVTALVKIHSNDPDKKVYEFTVEGKANVRVTGLPTTLQNGVLKTGPNPATNYIALQLNGQASSDIQYQLINIQGKAVLSGQGKLQNGRMTIDLSQVKQGNYLLKLQLGKEQIIRRIIKL